MVAVLPVLRYAYNSDLYIGSLGGSNEKVTGSPSPGLNSRRFEYAARIISTSIKVRSITLIILLLNEVGVFWNGTACSSVCRYHQCGVTCYHRLP
jgi:hypothetical protein